MIDTIKGKRKCSCKLNSWCSCTSNKMGKRSRSGSMGSASAKKRRRYNKTPYTRRYRPTYVRSGFGAIGRTPGGAVLGEMKYFDLMNNGTNVPNSQTWAAAIHDPSPADTLCVPVVGAGVNQRIGKEINILKLKIRGQFVYTAKEGNASAVAPVVIRYGIVQDMQTNATQLLASQVMSPTSGTNNVAPFTFQNIDNFGRFKVLKDKVCVIQDPNMTGTDVLHDINGKTVTFKMTLKFRQPIKVRFNNTNGGTVADIIDNSLHVFANSNAPTNGTIELRYLSRVCYKE